MTRWLLLLFVLCAPLGAPASWAQEVRPLAQAMAEMRSGNWAAAKITARRDGPAAVDVITWHHLRAGLGEAAEVMDFTRRNADWPGMPYLREKSEGVMAAAPDADVLEFFRDHRPETGAGSLTLARALSGAGQTEQAQAEVVRAWTSLAMSDSEHAAFLAQWDEELAAHHTVRLDMALWNGWRQNATAMLPLVDAGWQKLAEARLALRALEDGVNPKIDAVPRALQSDPGLAFDRFYWRDRKGLTDRAVELMLERSESAATLGNPQAWANRRIDLARAAMRAGRGEEAYRIAAFHGLTEGEDFAELEWIAGFVALRQLDRAEAARDHFQRFMGAVASPISLGRAGYWLGRAQEALGDRDGAADAYALGARHQTAFYGLLAAERGGVAFDEALRGTEVFPPWRNAAYTRSSVFSAAILLLASGERALGERFLTHLAESLDRTQVGQMGAMLVEMDRPHIQVMLGKRAAQYGIDLPGPYYALHPMIDRDLPVPMELALAITRRESEFDPTVISGAGARGLMQVMPATAEEVSGKLGLEFSANRLLTDPDYNITLGTAYLAELIGRFGGNPVMVAAAYNAGPSRPERWMAEMGDPRQSGVDMIDWIEMIPFTETRNYVMRVTESLPVYRARLGRDPLPRPFSAELVGSSLAPP